MQEPQSPVSNTPPEPEDKLGAFYKAFDEVAAPEARKASEDHFREQVRQNMTWGDTGKEILGGVPKGLQGFTTSTMSLGANILTAGTTGKSFETATKEEFTNLGSMSHFVSQQLPALLPVNKALQVGRAAWAGSKVMGAAFAGGNTAKFLTTLLGDGISAGIAFGGKQEKLADTLAPQAKGTFLEPVFDLLKTDPTGSESLNRFKNSIDNMGMGAAMTGLLHGVGVLYKAALSKEAGTAAKDVAKNLADDIAKYKQDYPEVASQLQKQLVDNPNLTEEEAFTALIKMQATVAQKSMTPVDRLAKVLTFVGHENEAKADDVAAQLAQAADPAATTPEAAARVDQQFADYYAQHGRRMEAEAKANGNPLPSSGETLITPPPNDPDLKKFNAFKKSEGTVLPSSGETLITPPKQQPLAKYDPAIEGQVLPDAPPAPDIVDGEIIPPRKALPGPVTETEKFLQAEAEKTSIAAEPVAPSLPEPAAKPAEEEWVNPLARKAPKKPAAPLDKVLPEPVKYRTATQGLGNNPKDRSDLIAWQRVKFRLSTEAKALSTPKKLAQAMKAEGRAMDVESRADQLLKDYLVKFDETKASDFMNRFKQFSDERLYKTNAAGETVAHTDIIDGRAIIGLSKTANVSDLVHELTHAYDRLGIADTWFGKIRQALGFDPADTSREASEAVAKEFERFAFHGELDHAWAGEGMQSLARFMNAVYKDIDNSPMGLEISAPVREAFRSMGGVEAIANNIGIKPEMADLTKRLSELNLDDTDQVQKVMDQVVEGHLNVATIKDQDSATVLKEIQNVLGPVIMKDRGGVETHDKVIRDALKMMQVMGGDPDTLSVLAQHVDKMRNISKDAVFFKTLTESWGAQTAKLMRAVADNPTDEALKKQLKVAWDSTSRMRLLMSDMTTNVARTLNKMKISLPAMKIDPDLLNVGYEQFMAANDQTGGKLIHQFSTILGASGDNAIIRMKQFGQMQRIVKDPNKNFMNLARSLYTSSILYNPHTFMGLQVLGGAVQTITKPSQYIAGGLVSLDKESVRFGLNLYKSLFHMTWDIATFSAGGRDAWNAVFQTFKDGVSVSEHNAIPHYVPSDVYTSLHGATKTVVNSMFNVATGSQRIMTTIDEAFRQFYGRAFLRARGMEEAFANGLKHGDAKFDQMVSDFADAGFGPKGTLLDSETIRELEDFTFKRPIQDSSSTHLKAMNRFLQAPGMWLFQPFLRTPVNIGREAVMSIPGIGFMSGAMREGFFSANKRVAAAYRGRQVMGGVALALFGSLAYSGVVTGAGPDRNSEAGRQWYNAGNRPYSLVFTNPDGSKESVGYMQMEPFGTLLGMMANTVEGLDQTNVPPEKKADAAWAVAAGMAKVWGDKRYLLGLSTLLKASMGDAAGFKQSVAQIASGAIPMSGLQGVMSDIYEDAEFKHSQGLLQRIQNRTLFKMTLEPQRDFFGDPVKSSLWNNVLPATISSTKGDPVVDELVRLNGRVTNGFSEKLRGLDLTEFTNSKGQSAFDRRMELRQTLDIGGYNLKQAMGRVMNSAAYKRINGDIPEGQAEQAALLQKVVEQYNAKGLDQLLREYPDLKKKFAASDPTAVKQESKKKAYQVISSIPS